MRHEYDASGNRTRTFDAKNQATTFTYDTRDRLTQITDPLNGQSRYAYDAVSNLTQLTNARNHATTFTYDAVNRLTQTRDALNQTTTYGYDPAGNRTSMTDRKGQVQTYAYDRAGNRTSLTNPGAITTTATYDGANRLTQMTQGTLTWTFGYDQAGNRRSLTHPNGTSTDYAYLNNHWLFSITDKAPGGVTFQSTSYGYDPNGNRTSQADPSGTTTFTYDALNRLTQAAYPAGYGTWSWVYDPVGNRTQQTGPGGTTNYTYDANNRLLTAGSTTYSYDQNGNLLSISTGQTFAWDVFNRLTQATGPGGTVTHTFNGDGLKVRRVGPDGTRNYYYDGIKPIWETDGAGAMTAQYDRDIFGNLLSRREASGARRYYHFDGLGSTTALTSESGAVTATLLYDAWGNQRAATGSDQGRYRFTGAELDQTTGLYHMGARFYDPTIGRWLSEDPKQDEPFEPATLNFYAYVNSNPVNFTDPSGLKGEAADSSIPPDIAELMKQLGVQTVEELYAAIRDKLRVATEFLQKYEGVFVGLGIAAALVAGLAAMMAIGVPSLAVLANVAVAVSVAMTVATVASQVSAGKLTLAQGVGMIALSAGSAIVGALMLPAATAAFFSRFLTNRQAGGLLGYSAVRIGGMVSPFVQEILAQRRR